MKEKRIWDLTEEYSDYSSRVFILQHLVKVSVAELFFDATGIELFCSIHALLCIFQVFSFWSDFMAAFLMIFCTLQPLFYVKYLHECTFQNLSCAISFRLFSLWTATTQINLNSGLFHQDLDCPLPFIRATFIAQYFLSRKCFLITSVQNFEELLLSRLVWILPCYLLKKCAFPFKNASNRLFFTAKAKDIWSLFLLDLYLLPFPNGLPPGTAPKFSFSSNSGSTFLEYFLLVKKETIFQFPCLYIIRMKIFSNPIRFFVTNVIYIYTSQKAFRVVNSFSRDLGLVNNGVMDVRVLTWIHPLQGTRVEFP